MFAVGRNGHSVWGFVPWLVASTNYIQGAEPNPSGGFSLISVKNCSIFPRVIDPLCLLAASLVYLENQIINFCSKTAYIATPFREIGWEKDNQLSSWQGWTFWRSEKVKEVISKCGLPGFSVLRILHLLQEIDFTTRVLRWFSIAHSTSANAIARDSHLIRSCSMSVKAIELKRLLVWSRTTDCACKYWYLFHYYVYTAPSHWALTIKIQVSLFPCQILALHPPWC